MTNKERLDTLLAKQSEAMKNGIVKDISKYENGMSLDDIAFRYKLFGMTALRLVQELADLVNEGRLERVGELYRVVCAK